MSTLQLNGDAVTLNGVAVTLNGPGGPVVVILEITHRAPATISPRLAPASIAPRRVAAAIGPQVAPYLWRNAA